MIFLIKIDQKFPKQHRINILYVYVVLSNEILFFVFMLILAKIMENFRH